jgi:hypothetical protein
MLRNLLVCGLVAGLCGGLLATGFASVAGEPAIERAIAYEDARAHATGGHAHGVEAVPVSRGLQKSAGLLTALLLYGVALGGIFALVFAFAYGRVGRAGPRVTASWLAAATFVVAYLVPFVKYPALPPAVGSPETIGRRTALYVVMIAVSVLCAVAAARLRPLLLRRMDGYAATVVAVAAYLAAVVGAGVALPGVHELPADFPAGALWRFREASVGLQAMLWATIGAVFAVTAQRVMTGRPMLALRPRRAAPAAD